jgi:hypothetical protein
LRDDIVLDRVVMARFSMSSASTSPEGPWWSASARVGGHRGGGGSMGRFALRAGRPSKAIDQPEVIREPARLWRDHHSGVQSAVQSCSMSEMTRC